MRAALPSAKYREEIGKINKKGPVAVAAGPLLLLVLPCYCAVSLLSPAISCVWCNWTGADFLRRRRLSISTPSENAMVCYLPLGYIPPDKELGRHEKCREKANRLYNHPASNRSYDSRNPEEGMYGGAVRGRQFIHSFSGLPEALDEVFCCLYAIDVGDMTPEEAVTILGKETFEQYAPILH